MEVLKYLFVYGLAVGVWFCITRFRDKMHHKEYEKIKERMSKTNYSIKVYLLGEGEGNDMHVNTFYPEESVELTLKKMLNHYKRESGNGPDGIDPKLYFVVTENTIVSKPVMTSGVKRHIASEFHRYLLNSDDCN